MSDFAAPTGPPPPKLPSGWKAVWNDQYNEWFYVNIYTKRSTWERPTEPVYPPTGDDGLAPPGAPPGYQSGDTRHVGPEKPGLSPYGGGSAGGAGRSQNDLSNDERLARELQEQENARAGTRGAADTYYSAPAGSSGPGVNAGPYMGADQSRGAGGKSGGFLGKLLGKHSSSQPQYQQQPYAQQGYAGGMPQQQYGGGYPPQQGYYGPAQGGYMPQQQYVQQRRTGGLGTGGAAALGLGGGLLGGMMLGDMMGDMGDGGDGGGDMGGGDMGGDMGGGDMGGGGM